MSILGNPILLSGGDNGGNVLFNFPLSISSEEPTAEREGHIWINTTRGNNITSVHIVDSPTIDLPNNSLIFEVYDTKNVSMTLVNDFKSSSIGTVQISYGNEVAGNHPWLVGSDGDTEIYLAYPRVFIKTDDSFYLETAYVWNGTYWMLLSQADTYLFTLIRNNSTSNTPTLSPINVYNITGLTYPKHSDIVSASTVRANSMSISDANGTYIAYQDVNKNTYVYKRIGDVFSLYFSMSETQMLSCLPESYRNNYTLNVSKNTYGNTIKMSATGEYFAVSYVGQNKEKNKVASSGIIIFKNNGVNYEFYKYLDVCNIDVSDTNNVFYPDKSQCIMQINDSFDTGIFATIFSGVYNGTTAVVRTYNSVTFDILNNHVVLDRSFNGHEIPLCAISKDGSFGVMGGTGGSTSSPSFIHYAFTIDKSSKTVKNVGEIYSSSSGNNSIMSIHISSDNIIWLVAGTHATAGSKVELHQGKIINGTLSKLLTYYDMTDGNGEDLYNQYASNYPDSDLEYINMCVDVKNNLLYLVTSKGIYVCNMVREESGKLTSYAKIATINNINNYTEHCQIAITPNVVV